MIAFQWACFIIGAYLVGAIPFGFLIGKARGVDIREHGSKNIGATNTGRVLGRKWGFLCFGLDLLKGLIPTLTAGQLMNLTDIAQWQERIPLPSTTNQFLWLGVACAAILGHMFPVYLKLKGGKGVATAFGAMLGVFPFLTFPALGAVVVWLAAVRFFRMVSLASMAAAVSLALWILVGCIPHDIDTNPDASFFAEFVSVWPFFTIAVALAVLVMVRHRANIGRIIAGTEPKIERKRNSSVNRTA